MADPFWLTWWLWLAAALALGILEIVLPGFIFLGFAIGAAVTGLLLLIPGLAPSLPILMLIFSTLSLISWLILRRMFSLPHGQVKTFNHDINE
ncbi:NfeD family protein [Ruegeria meonggei]|uniref:NfeD family protein n=1 Tax=Ruegeria meonggei TaxID=1446476 RepID=UPI00367131A1